jgi:xylulokinase
MHGLVLCAERPVALRPAITWLDRRAEAEAQDYERLPADLRARLGNAPSPGMAGPILRWLARHEPEVYGRSAWMLQPKDWLRFRLTGRAATDPTDASGTLLFDLARGVWALGLRADLLPEIRPPAQLAGTLLPAAALRLGLPPGLPVAIGAADTATSLLAAHLPSGQGLLTLGTGGQLIIPVPPNSDRPFPDNPERGNRAVNVFRSADGGTYLLGAAQNVGVTLAHQRDDLLRAALEGVAFLLRGKLDDLRAAGRAPAALRLGGGGSRRPGRRAARRGGGRAGPGREHHGPFGPK